MASGSADDERRNAFLRYLHGEGAHLRMKSVMRSLTHKDLYAVFEAGRRCEAASKDTLEGAGHRPSETGQ